jgi:hypothetical protein
MKMEQTECSETSAYKIQTPRNYPEENIQQENGRIASRETLQFAFLIKFYVGGQMKYRE